MSSDYHRSLSFCSSKVPYLSWPSQILEKRDTIWVGFGRVATARQPPGECGLVRSYLKFEDTANGPSGEAAARRAADQRMSTVGRQRGLSIEGQGIFCVASEFGFEPVGGDQLSTTNVSLVPFPGIQFLFLNYIARNKFAVYHMF